MREAKYYSIDSVKKGPAIKKIYDASFNEIGTFEYTSEVEGLTRITRDPFIAQLHGKIVYADTDGWMIIEKEAPVEALKAACHVLVKRGN